MFYHVNLLLKTHVQGEVWVKLLQFYHIFDQFFTPNCLKTAVCLYSFDGNLYTDLVLEVSQEQDLHTVYVLSMH